MLCGFFAKKKRSILQLSQLVAVLSNVKIYQKIKFNLKLYLII